MKKKWQIVHPDPDLVNSLCRKLNCHPITATMLINREFRTPEDATLFLKANLADIRSPFQILGMEEAVQRIYTAIYKKEKILIFGDYDVDGVTSTVILLDFFDHIGADASYYIPHREKEGYGLHPAHITHPALTNKISLIITADCGSGSHEAVRAAAENGIDVIVTDHHNISSDIPPAIAVINPKRKDCPSGLANLAGVGVAFCLLICLRKYLRDKNYWQEICEPNLKKYCDLVALGTVADMVPLRAENRVFSKTGLELIGSGQRLAQHEEVRRQEDRQREPGAAMDGERPPAGVAARAPVGAPDGGAAHAARPIVTATTARKPSASSTAATASIATSMLRRFPPRISATIVRSPIGAWIATPRTNTP